MSSGCRASSPPAKRRKVAESCKLCRIKKTRCDGQRPVCSPCTAKGVACEYSGVTVQVSGSTLVELDMRLRMLEEQALATSARGLPHATAANRPETTSDLAYAQLQRKPGQGHCITTSSDLDQAADLPVAAHSTHRFLEEMMSPAGSPSGAQLFLSSLWGKNDAWPVETDTSSMVVPKRAIADNLVHCYEKFVYPLFPILHMPTFKQSYEHLWQPLSTRQLEHMPGEATLHATLNVVFALGCINNSSIERKLKLRTAETFYTRARRLLPLDALDVPSLEIVHYLLLMVHYLSFTRYSNRLCNTLAVAFRVAQALGLHLDSESSSTSQLKREMSRRVWHLCLTFERLFNSSLFGPRIMAECDTPVVPLPKCIDDEYLDEQNIGSQPIGVPSKIEALIVTIEVFRVIEKVLKIKYTSLGRGPSLPELSQILQLNGDLDEIEQSLPSFLKLDERAELEPPVADVLKLQADGALIRILHVRLMLLRPVVLVTARQQVSVPWSSGGPWRAERAVESTLRNEASRMCLQAATSAINRLHGNLRTTSRIFSSTAVFITLSAATLIVAASLIPGLGVSLDGGDNEDPYRSGLTKAFQVLDEHRYQVEGALRAKTLLQTFLERVKEDTRWRRDDDHASNNNSGDIRTGQPSPEIQAVAGEFDFSDPLWDFQWGGSGPLFDTVGPYFDLGCTTKPV